MPPASWDNGGFVTQCKPSPETRSTQHDAHHGASVTPSRIQIAFDDHRLVADAGLILPVTLAQHLGLGELRRTYFTTLTWALVCAGRAGQRWRPAR